MPESQAARAETFRKLHRGGKILILPNAWDVASARIVESEGYPAIASTSAGIAYAMGYPDGEKLSREQMLARVGEIARSVEVPVSADAEAGYGPGPEDAAATAVAVIESGAVGLNFEDSVKGSSRSLVELSLQMEKIRAMVEAGAQRRVPLVLNARTDVYLLDKQTSAANYDEALRRSAAYRAAGADCVFLPGLRDPATIERFVNDLKCPINILATPEAPTIPELQKLGVARVSVGSGVMRATLGLVRKIARELRDSGTYSNLEFGLPYEDLNKMFSSK